MPDELNQPELFDPEKTITANSGGSQVTDFGQIREDFRIYPDEDGVKYENLKLLGMGGMGVVYSADDPTLERPVALKILREPFRQNREQIGKFINEARITARIDHPNIVAVHQLGVNSKHGVYFSMRRISGETLQSAIRRLNDGNPEALRTYTRRRLLDIFIAGCYGVAAAHEKKILHCDLKPANIMIGSFGEVLVLDWGLAREFDAPADENKKEISGTPAYMAPELVTGELKTPDEQTEVYALGTILYSILSRKQSPFDLDLDQKTLMEKVALGKYIPLHPPKGERLSRELSAICRKAMERDREKRYRTVSGLLNDLHNYRDGYPVAAYSPNIFYRFFKFCRRRPAIPLTLIAASAALMLNSFAGNIINFFHDRSLHRSSMINIDLANNYYRKLNFAFSQKTDYSGSESILHNAIMQKDQQMHTQLALMEFFSVLDAASGFSPAGKREFVLNHAPEIFRKILQLSMHPVNYEQFGDTFERISRNEFFPGAVHHDPALKNLVEIIGKKSGSIYFYQANQPWKAPVSVMDGNGKTFTLAPNDVGRIDLPAGEVTVTFANGVRMYFRIVPGSRESVAVPEIQFNDPAVKVIPADHCVLDIPGVGETFCSLPEFFVLPVRITEKFTHKEAEKIIAGLKKSYPFSWQLPSAAQIYKIRNRKKSLPGSFYGLPLVENSPILLRNGEFFDPAAKRVSPKMPDSKGVLYLVSPNSSDEAR